MAALFAIRYVRERMDDAIQGSEAGLAPVEGAPQEGES